MSKKPIKRRYNVPSMHGPWYSPVWYSVLQYPDRYEVHCEERLHLPPHRGKGQLDVRALQQELNTLYGVG